MQRRLGGSAFVLGAALTATGPTQAQTPPEPNPLEITVTAKRLDEARTSIQPSLGATKYEFSPRAIEDIPQGEQAPLNQVLLRAPGVAQDGFGQVHVRGDHGNLQYRLDGVQLPEGLSLFGNALATQYARNMSLITGALPAQYGVRTAGVVDIALKSGTTDPGAEASMTVGTRDFLQPSFTYGGRSGAVDYFATGLFTHNNYGIENPSNSYTALHDNTDQWHVLGKVTGIVDENTRLSFIAGGSSARFQIPNSPGQVPTFTVNGFSDLNSGLLDQRQWEKTYFGIASLQKHYEAVDFQLSGFARYSSLAYKPDPLGDLMFNGIAPWAKRTNLAVGVQGDASWQAASNHTVRGGFLVQRERSTALTNANVLAVDEEGEPIDDQFMQVINGFDQVGWQYGIYLQDEWKVSPTVTLNFGARFDVLDAASQENQLSPRLNVVWQPNNILTAHAGYARYFTPPPLAQINNTSIAVLGGTTGAPPGTLNDVVKAERSHYFDGGFTLKPLPGLTVGFDAYYKISQNLLDEGQFGAPIVLTSFNYAEANVKGFELSGSYDDGPWSVYGNLAWSEAKGSNINSAQFNFPPEELAFIAQNYIFLDHNQSWTASAGAAYIFNQESPWATRVSADMIYGNGLRTSITTPNDSAIPAYAVVNLSATQKIPIKGTRGTQFRVDVLNLFDNSYQIRDGAGVGVGAPQFGLRRTFLFKLTQKF